MKKVCAGALFLGCGSVFYAQTTDNSKADVYFTADFLYWYLGQEDLILGQKVSPQSAGDLGLFTGSNQSIHAPSDYTPGFRVGMGFDMSGMDHWNMYAEYTWYQNDQSSTETGEIVLGTFGQDVIAARRVSLQSKYHFNNLQLSLQRALSFTKNLTANFGWGLKSLWIDNKWQVHASHMKAFPLGLFTELSMKEPLDRTFWQKSWSLGPRISLETSWLLGKGLRLCADMAASVLYTRYTKLEETLEGSATYGIVADLQSNPSTNYGTLRAITETFLGVGFTTNVGSHGRYRLDFLAGYGFDVYWNQNMLSMSFASQGTHNVYLHGIDVAIRWDF